MNQNLNLHPRQNIDDQPQLLAKMTESLARIAEEGGTSETLTAVFGAGNSYRSVSQVNAAVSLMTTGFFPAITPLLQQASDLANAISHGSLPLGGEQAVSFTDNDGNAVSGTYGVLLYSTTTPFNSRFQSNPDWLTSGFAGVQGSSNVPSAGLLTSSNNYGSLQPNTNYTVYLIATGTAGQYYVVFQLGDGSDTVIDYTQTAPAPIFYDEQSWLSVTGAIGNLAFPSLVNCASWTCLADIYTIFVPGFAAGCDPQNTSYMGLGNESLGTPYNVAQSLADVATAATTLATAIECIPALVIPSVYDAGLFGFDPPAQVGGVYVSPLVYPLPGFASGNIEIVGGTVVNAYATITWGLGNPNPTVFIPSGGGNHLPGITLVTTNASGVLSPNPAGQIASVDNGFALIGTFSEQPLFPSTFYMQLTIKQV